MKKFISAGLITLLLTGCTSGISDKNQLIGNWACTINYDDFNIQTIDNIRFSSNGSFNNTGTIAYPIKKPIFIYSSQSTGRWELRNNDIIYRVSNENIQRRHRHDVMMELQHDKELNQYEESLFSTISDNEANKTIVFHVTYFSKNEMKIKQEIKEHRNYAGNCLRI